MCASCRGLPSQAFEYILYNKGIMGEDTYPYKAKVILPSLSSVSYTTSLLPFSWHSELPEPSAFMGTLSLPPFPWHHLSFLSILILRTSHLTPVSPLSSWLPHVLSTDHDALSGPLSYCPRPAECARNFLSSSVAQLGHSQAPISIQACSIFPL